MLGRSTVLPCSSPSTSFTASSTLRQPHRPAPRGISAALVTDTPRPKATESNGSRNGNGKVGEGGPTIINGQVRAASICPVYLSDSTLLCRSPSPASSKQDVFACWTHVHPCCLLNVVTLPFIVESMSKSAWCTDASRQEHPLK